LKQLGLHADYTMLRYIYGILNTKSKYFIVEETDRFLPSVASHAVLFMDDPDYASSSHCQDGQGGKVNIIKILNVKQTSSVATTKSLDRQTMKKSNNSNKRKTKSRKYKTL
jgi:hypothetical protein